MNILGWLVLLFTTLKLTNHIDWSWLWVLSPLWIPLVLAGTISVILYFIETPQQREIRRIKNILRGK
jgi:hypothetical protein